jgi:hypothetical protein
MSVERASGLVVAWSGPEDVCQIATSFAEFVGVYLDEPDRLWPKG